MNTDEKNSALDLNGKPQESAPKQETPKKSPKKESRMNATLRKIGFWFLFFLLGALTVGLVVYLPARNTLNEAQVELDRLQSIESEYEVLVVDYARAESERAIYKILANASQMQVALVNENTNRINQYIGYIEEDLSSLSISNFPEIPGTLQQQFTQVKNKIPADREGAVLELQNFQNDLLLLIDNLG